MRTGDVHDLIVVIGTCVLGTWVSQLVREARDLSGGALDVAEGEDDAIFPDLGRSGGAPRVLMVRALTERLMDRVAARSVPALAVLDDPVDSVRYTKAEREVDVLNAMREQTRIAVANHLYFDNPAVAVVPRGFQGEARDLVASVLGELPLTFEDAAREQMLDRFGGPAGQRRSIEQMLEALVPNHARLASLRDAISADEAAIVRQALSPMVLGAVSRDIGSIVWTAKVFLFGDRPNEVAPPVADVTGAARILYYGPYFHLPPGLWKVRFIVAFSPEMRGTPFRIVVYCGGDAIAKVVLRPVEGGAFEGAFAMRHAFPARSIEIHFMNEEGTIEGHVALGQLIFTKVEG